ncbi:hypothetical protein [Proteiniborus sp.]
MVDSDPYGNSFLGKMNNKVEGYTILSLLKVSSTVEGGRKYGKGIRSD